MSASRLLGSFWFLYFAGMGLVFPYQTLYFSENAALAGTQLGMLLAVRPLVGVFGQPFWGQVADRTGSRSRVLTLLAVGTALCTALVPLATGFLPLLAAFALASFFSTSVIPMTTSVTMASLGPDPTVKFGRVRVWGTISFLMMVVAFPPWLDWIQERMGWESLPGGPSEPGLGLIFLLAAALTLVAALVPWRVVASASLRVRSRPGDLRLLLAHPPYLRALAYTFLAYLLLQGPMMLFPVFIAERGGDIATLSKMWIPMVALEIPLVLYSGNVLARLGPRTLLAIGVLADGVRWTACALTDSLPLLFGLQLLHGVVIAGLMIGIQLYVETVVPERLRSTGQTLLAMAGISMGGVLSSGIAGWVLEGYGIETVYLIAGNGALILGLLTWWFLPHPTRPSGDVL